MSLTWETSKLVYKAIGIELYKYESALLSFITDSLIPENPDSGTITEVSQMGKNGLIGVSAAQFDISKRNQVIELLEELKSQMILKFPCLETIDYEFNSISPTMVNLKMKLRDDADLTDDNLHTIESAQKKVEYDLSDEIYAAQTYNDPTINKKMGCIFGLAIGDALGAPVEFQARGSFKPVTDFTSGGAFNLKEGQWTDDTAMALCLGQSLIERKGFDPKDQLEKYIKWLDTGFMSCTGEAIGLGNTISDSLDRYRKTKNPFCGSSDPMTAGNGTIMRLAPVPIFYHPDHESVVMYSVESCKTTHKAQEVLDATFAMTSILCHLFDGKDKFEALELVSKKTFNSKAVSKILCTKFDTLNPEAVESTGYVIHTLNAALWAFMTSASFEEAVLKAVNLGDDADTVGAVCGQFAGAYWSYSGIPEKWLSKVARFGLIKDVGENLVIDKHKLSNISRNQ